MLKFCSWLHRFLLLKKNKSFSKVVHRIVDVEKLHCPEIVLWSHCITFAMTKKCKLLNCMSRKVVHRILNSSNRCKIKVCNGLQLSGRFLGWSLQRNVFHVGEGVIRTRHSGASVAFRGVKVHVNGYTTGWLDRSKCSKAGFAAGLRRIVGAVEGATSRTKKAESFPKEKPMKTSLVIPLWGARVSIASIRMCWGG